MMDETKALEKAMLAGGFDATGLTYWDVYGMGEQAYRDGARFCDCPRIAYEIKRFDGNAAWMKGYEDAKAKEFGFLRTTSELVVAEFRKGYAEWRAARGPLF